MLITDFERTLWKRELTADFQPIVDLQSGAILAIEARVRWKDESGQPLTARQVLDIVHTEQAHDALDRSVLERVTEAFAWLRREGLGRLDIAMNVSAATCASESSAEQFCNLLGDGTMRDRLRLELPAEVFGAVEPPPMVQHLERLGYSFAVDHVDAEFDALERKELPLRSIKLREALVEDALADSQSAERIRALCAAARERKLRVGAEGITRLDQMEFLRDAGCHEGQGPLVSRPRALDDLLFLLQRGRCW